jgi:mannosyl-oligosaccharide alpha-1,2-mannosidase
MREKYILMLTIATFLVFCIGGFFFLPELKAGTRMAITNIRDIGPDLTGIRPPIDHHVSGDSPDDPVNSPERFVIPAPDIVGHKPGKLSDMRILAEKIRREMNHINMSQQHAVAPAPPALDLPRVNVPAAAAAASSPDHSSAGLPDGQDHDPEARRRRDVVKNMMLHGWNNYVQYAWGENELRPISRRGHSPGIFGSTKLGASIIDAMDTLWIMGLKDEFTRARDWIESNLSLDHVNADISVRGVPFCLKNECDLF